jgi:bifunctional DNA-binding transcriptional regulator/antitoxin component of YhaV-PrlF toxin-antitoxin module
LTSTVSFLARLQASNRVQVPVEVRWTLRLEAGELLRIEVNPRVGYDRRAFYVRFQKGGRFTVPNEVVEVLKLRRGKMLEVKIRRTEDNE